MADETPDWTVKDGRSNSSDVYEECVATVARLIRGSARDIVSGNTGAVARLIVSQLAHTGLRLAAVDLYSSTVRREETDA